MKSTRATAPRKPRGNWKNTGHGLQTTADALHGLATLQNGIAALGLALPEGAAEKLLAYRDLLMKWNRAYNLTAAKTPEEIVTHHLLDSLAILPWVDAEGLNAAMLDVGSGGGLPGLVIAVARPDLPVTLVDAVRKKAVFLRQAVIELGLMNVTSRHGRVESLDGRHAVITSRAFAELADFVALTRHLLAPGGHWLAMKGKKPDAELAALPAWIQVSGIWPLAVPGLDAKRHLVMLRIRE
ncbi:MAG: 16S rRNA (guanine(527)-N(7))-methyltransferase RsmG [Zoogloeaceae bacterium]|jgi:16S rRNA (guanine527-N7)-methyltransferase|nr:16S rRNA (guanine(527)-N(7))-methyltransferase RsmG [Zoogloeaceae bacterium]